MKHYVIRYLTPQETWVAAENAKDAFIRARKMLLVHAGGDIPALLHSIEPAPTNPVDDEPAMQFFAPSA